MCRSDISRCCFHCPCFPPGRFLPIFCHQIRQIHLVCLQHHLGLPQLFIELRMRRAEVPPWQFRKTLRSRLHARRHGCTSLLKIYPLLPRPPSIIIITTHAVNVASPPLLSDVKSQQSCPHTSQDHTMQRRVANWTLQRQG